MATSNNTAMMIMAWTNDHGMHNNDIMAVWLTCLLKWSSLVFEVVVKTCQGMFFSFSLFWILPFQEPQHSPWQQRTGSSRPRMPTRTRRWLRFSTMVASIPQAWARFSSCRGHRLYQVDDFWRLLLCLVCRVHGPGEELLHAWWWTYRRWCCRLEQVLPQKSAEEIVLFVSAVC